MLRPGTISIQKDEELRKLRLNGNKKFSWFHSLKDIYLRFVKECFYSQKL